MLCDSTVWPDECVWAADGKLLAAGGQSGMIQVFELSSRAILRQYKKNTGGHTKAVQSVAWGAPQGGMSSHLVSGSDDNSVSSLGVSLSRV